jgi:hypothetical protein
MKAHVGTTSAIALAHLTSCAGKICCVRVIGSGMCADSGAPRCREAVVNRALDRVRQKVAAELGEVPSDAAALTWVTDFPMFEWCALDDWILHS